MSNSSNGNFLESMSDAIVEVVGRVSPSVVQVSSGRRAFGSGIVWDNEGKIVTSAHVVGRASSVEISFAGDGEKNYEGRIVGQDRFSDVALIEVQELAEKSSLKPVTFGDSEKLSSGQIVLALANPFGQKVSATLGIITNASAMMGGRAPWADSVIVSDTKLNPGYSGGPLVDASGKMIGMNMAFVANRGISIPINSLKETVKSLSSEGEVKRAYLGIVSDSISLPEEVVKEINQEQGLIILSVERGAPAKKAGVAVGDIVVRLNSRPVRSFYDLRRLLTSDVIGKPTSLSVLRGEKLTELTVTPIEA